MRSVQRQRECEEELKLFREWKTAKAKRKQDAALFELWQRCRPATAKALKHLAAKLSAKRKEHITVSLWLHMHGMDYDDAHAEVFPAILEAAKRFDPRRGNKFSTYAYPFILGRIYRAINSNDALKHSQYEANEHVLSQGEGTWKRANGKRVPIVGGSETPGWKYDMWRCLELDPHNGGAGQYSDRGKFLRSLSIGELNRIRDWLEANKERTIEAYSLGRWSGLSFAVGFEAWAKQLPPDVRHADSFKDKLKDGLPLQGVAIRSDGKKWDLDTPIRAMLLEQQGKPKRRIAELLGTPWSTYKDLRKRMDEQGFSAERFTPDDLEAIARGNQGRKPES
jgi:hypothetical protein